MQKNQKGINPLAVIGPGILIAATGVGAGDLAGGAFAGSKLGTTVLWAVLLGAFIKYVITEGLTRWQLVTGHTLLEGAILKLGPVAQYFFLSYFLVWTFGVGSSLISACGVAAHALFPVFNDPEAGKIVFGIIHSLLGLALVLWGSFKLFEWTMSICVGVMFLLVLITAYLSQPDWGEVFQGLVLPVIPSYPVNGVDQGISWTMALMGGVGGTLTIISYGYWIREEGREGPGMLRLCRIDLGIAYLVTALFGIAVVIIASNSSLERQPSATLVVTLAEQLGDLVGPAGRSIFLVGAWAAMFSSLLGVWQSVPYMFADYWHLSKHRKANSEKVYLPGRIDTKGKPYRSYLFVIALIPLTGLLWDFELVQLLNSAYGALVMPMVALTLLLLNSRSDWVGTRYKNRPLTLVTLLLILLFFSYLGIPGILNALKGLF